MSSPRHDGGMVSRMVECRRLAQQVESEDKRIDNMRECIGCKNFAPLVTQIPASPPLSQAVSLSSARSDRIG
jgi:hypothetical protein